MPAPTAPLHAGIARRDITPPPGLDLSGFVARLGPNTGVLDPISATALVLGHGSTRAALVAFDLLGLSAESVATVRARITDRTGIPGEHVMFAASHTHSGPAPQILHGCGRMDPAYMDRLFDAIVDAVAEAAGKAVPVQATFAQRTIDRLAALHHNRRVKGGPLDSTLALVALRRLEDDAPLAVLFSFACHPVVLGHDSRLVSADWVGAARRTLEAALPGALALFGNGPAGNVNPAQRGTAEIAQEMGQAVGEESLTALTEAKPLAAELAVARIPIALPMRPLPDAATLTQVRDESRARAETARTAGTPGAEVTYKSECVFAEWAQAALDAGLAGRAPEPSPAEVQALRIGRAILAALPGESFLEFGLELRREFGDSVVPLGYTNANPGYVPWPDAYPQSGYEVDVAYKYYGFPAGFAVEAGQGMLAAARRAVRAVGGAPS